jgi:RHS repeat-associated protein
VWSAVYDSFGNCQVDASSTITNNLHGPGQYHDAETGLYYNLNRYYDPATGRYLTTDPIEDGLNLYAYCYNDPINLMDPEGLCALRIMGGLAEMAIGFTFGTATSPTIAGGVIGALVMAHGADQVYAGLKGLLGYDDTSYTSGLLQSLGFTPTQANLLDSAASVVATAGIGAVSMARSATVASTRAASAAQEAAAARAAAREASEGTAERASNLISKGISPAPGTRVRPEGIPENWRIRPTDTKGGTHYYDPSNKGNSVRVMQGNPNSPYPNSQTPYVRWQNNGKPLDSSGNVLPTAKSPDAHIPLQDFKFRPEVFE